MKLGGNGGRITDNQAIVALLIIAIICIVVAIFWFPFRILGFVLASIAGICAIGVWQILLNEAYRESRSEKGQVSHSLFDTYKRKGE